MARLRVLDEAGLASFRESGYLRLPAAFPAEAAEVMAGEVWEELAREHGIERADPATWRPPPRSPRGAKASPRNREVLSERFLGAISDLLGDDDWRRPPTWGGFLVTFPQQPGTAFQVPTDGWHWDGDPDGRGLLIFSFYSRVEAGGGGTCIVSGSHRLVREFGASLGPEEAGQPHRVHRKRFPQRDPWLAELWGRAPDLGERVERFAGRETDVRGVPCRVVELTGEPGDVVFCNLGMLHCANPNRAEVPRLMRVKFLFLDDSTGGVGPALGASTDRAGR